MLFFKENAIILKSDNANGQTIQFGDSAFDSSTSASLHNMEADSNYDNAQAATETSTTFERSSMQHENSVSTHLFKQSHLVEGSTKTLRLLSEW